MSYYNDEWYDDDDDDQDFEDGWWEQYGDTYGPVTRLEALREWFSHTAAGRLIERVRRWKQRHDEIEIPW